MKNSLATVQSITAQTLRTATDLSAAREAIEARIGSLSRAHDLLTDRSWTGANLHDVVRKALEPFDANKLQIDGPTLDLSPQYALALSLALHELANNAVKYGALSSMEGKVDLSWSVEHGVLTLDWRERGGPRVAPPTRRGFGSRLLESNLFQDLGSQPQLQFLTEGVRYQVAIELERQAGLSN